MNVQLVTIVTGAGRGIGLGIAEALAKRGDRLVLADTAFSDSSAQSAASTAVGNDAILLDVDVTDTGQIENMLVTSIERFGRVDCLVHAAGLCRIAPVCELTEVDWDATFAVNLRAAFLLSKAVGARMMQQQAGRIVHIASTAAMTATAGAAAYAASKHGLMGLVRAVACDLAPFNITVNAVCPGNTDTPMLRTTMAQRAKIQGAAVDEVLADISHKTPMGRIGRPEDVAGAVMFLTSDEAGYITGQSITVDGGRSLNLM